MNLNGKNQVLEMINMIVSIGVGFVTIINFLIFTLFHNKANEKNGNIKNLNGRYTSASIVFYTRLYIFFLVYFLLVAIYLFVFLAKIMKNNYVEELLMYYFIVFLFTLIGVRLISVNPLKFKNKKTYLGGAGLIGGTIICSGGICGSLSVICIEERYIKTALESISLICILGLFIIYFIAMLVLDENKRYHNQFIRLCNAKDVVEENIIVGSIIQKKGWIQYKCQSNGQIEEKSLKMESFNKIEYYNIKEKPKLVQINTVCNGSTGRIMHAIQSQAHNSGWETISFVGRRKVYTDLPCERFGNYFSFWIHVAITTLFDRQGHGSLLQTKRLVARLREENPDVIHLHVLHGYYLHIPTLFRYLQEEYRGKVFWTFHDLWPITGHCPHFVIAKCDKWRTECKRCPNKRVYPISLGLDQSKRNFREKKTLFTGLNHLEILVPSYWMAEQVRNSFLKDYPIHVVGNGIDLDVFRYTPDKQIHEKYAIPQDKKIVLGVANIWEERKGLKQFIELSYVLPENYVIVLVGRKNRHLINMCDNIISVNRTEDCVELVKLYSEATVFMNPSLEESFSLVTVEALACGTPVVTVDSSATKELVNSQTGIVLSREAKANDFASAILELDNQYMDRDETRKSILKYRNDLMAEKILELY